MNYILTLIAVLFLFSNTSAQIDTEGIWDTYMANYGEGKIGSTVLRMDLIDGVPFKEYSKVLITGVTYESSRDDGFPDEKTFEVLYEINDQLEAFLIKESRAVHVGSFTCDNERLCYFYIKNDQKLEKKLKRFYKTKFPDFKPYINIKEDLTWETYTKFLYPNEETLHYMYDMSVVRALMEGGDELNEKRRVDHWLWFKKEEDLKAFIPKSEAIGYTMEGFKKVEEKENLYSLQIWKEELPDQNTIYSITSKLRALAKECNGEYDGWETFIIKK